jgi:hypothetical protein
MQMITLVKREENFTYVEQLTGESFPYFEGHD